MSFLLDSYRFAVGSSPAISNLLGTVLQTGDGTSPHTATGIDLSGGGMAWRKARSASQAHAVDFSPDGTTMQRFAMESAGAAVASPCTFSGSGASYADATDNVSGRTYVTWLFRRASRFFDVVTYTGNGASRTISHSLGIAPGFILIKRLDASGTAYAYHADLGAGAALPMNTSYAVSSTTFWGSTAPTGSVFSLGNNSNVNTSGASYVALLFADDTAADGVIQPFTYVGNGSSTGPVVDLGWQPQLVIVKANASSTNWMIFDTTRTPDWTGNDAFLRCSSNGAEIASADHLALTATGFQIVGATSAANTSGVTYYGLAIREP